MTVIIKDRVKQTATAIVATGDLSLVGTPSGYVSFSSVLNSGEQVYYCVENGSAFEVGIGTYGASGANTFRRDTVLNSSTGSRLSVSGRATVFITVPASKFPFVTESGELSLALSTLNDVTLTAPASGESLKYNGSAWINEVVSGYTTEEAQDAIGSILSDSSSISFSYNDATPSISASVKNSGITDVMISGGIDAAKIGSGNVSSAEFDYLDGVTSSIQNQIDSKVASNIQIIAGTGLSGGGNLSTNRTINLANTTVIPGSYTLSSFTVDAQGRITAAASGSVDLSSYVSLSGSYSNPSWITGLAWSKISSTPTSLSGYGISGVKTDFDSACTDGNFMYVGDAPTSHTHGNITNAGAIGSTSGLPIITTASGVLTTGSFGTTTGTFAEGNDSRITGALSTTTAASTYLPLAGGTLTPSSASNVVLRITGASSQSAALQLWTTPSSSDNDGKILEVLPNSGGYSGLVKVGWNSYISFVSTQYANTPHLRSTASPNNGGLSFSADDVVYMHGGGVSARFSGGAFAVTGTITASSTLTAGGLIVRNGTTATQFDLTNTYTSATSFEVLRSKANAGSAYQIGSAIGSAGGTNRDLSFGQWNSAGTFSNLLNISGASGGSTVRIATTSGAGTCGLEFGSTLSGWQMGQIKVSYDSLGGWGTGFDFVINAGSGPSHLATLFSISSCGRFVFTQLADSGSPTAFTLTGAAHTTLTASTEATDVNFNLARTVQFATGALTTQRAFRIQAPTYSFVGASTITTASTLSISGAPAAGTNATITNAHALNVETGRARFGGNLLVDGGLSTFGGGLTIGPFTGYGASTDYIQASSSWSVEPHLLGYPWHFGFDTSTTRVTIQTANSTTGVRVGSDGAFMFSSTTNSRTGTIDLFLMRDGAGVLSQRNGTNAQTLQVYNTYTSSTSFENLQFKAVAGAAYQIGSAIGSAGGTTRGVEIGSWDSAGTFSGRFITSNTGVVTINSSGRTTFGVGGGTNIAYFTSNGSFMGLGFNRTGVYGVGLRCDNGYSVSICAHNNDEASAWGQVFTVQTLTNGSDISGKITTTHGAATNLPASTEATDVNFNFARTVQFATGALTTQRAMRIQAPTYSFVGASTITTASTLSISGAPAAGTNATITNAYALNIESGNIGMSSTSYILTGGGTGYFYGRAGHSNSWVGPGSAGVGLTSFGYFGSMKGEIGDGILMMTGAFGLGTSLTGYASTGADTLLSRDAAGIFAQRNGTNAQEFRIYTTYTSTTSYERLEIKGKSGANFEIGAENGSAGGTLRGITIGGYSAGSSTITPWITLTNTGAATFTISNSEVASIATGSVNLTSDTNMIFRLYAHGEISSGGIIQSYKARGADRNTKLYPAGSDNLIGFNVYGWDESSNNWSGAKATWSVSAPSTWTATSNGTQHTWTTTDAADATKTLTNRMRLQSNGNLTLGGITDTGGLFQIIGTNNAVTGFGTATNRLRFTDTDTTTATDQPIGEIEFYSSDASSPGAGVKASFLCAAESATPSACFKWGIDTTTGSLTNVMTLASSGLLTVTGGIVSSKVIRQNSEITYTPTGTTQTLTLNDGNHLTLNLTSATGTVTATLTVPTSSSSGTIIINQHASAAKGITWAVSSGTIKWMGTQPTWSSDAVSSVRIVSWRWNGSIMYLMSTDVGT